ncbi:MAG: response regulator, partial [Acidobacteriia bacterium]|nr:response regulator [Terriglobia bacterium]
MICTSVDSGAQALRSFQEALVLGKCFDLLVTDYQMAEMDGFELVEHIRSKGGQGQLAVVMLSSSLQLAVASRARKLGVTSYLTKPVGHSELLEAIFKALGESAPEHRLPISGLAAGEAGPGRLRILLAEDNRVNQLVACRLLEREGHQVVLAGNGNEVLAIHLREQVKFDLILMDVQMPEMDGFEAAAAIRRREARTGEHIPIIALTAHAMIGDRERCLAGGMDGYVSKPIRLDELASEMERCGIRLRRGAPLEEEPTPGRLAPVA